MKGALKLFRCVWRDGALIPEPRFARWCDDQFGEGEVVQLDRHEDRSTNSHNHYFAALKTCWENLPDIEVQERFPTVEAMRKWALIKAGFYRMSEAVFDTPADAARAGAIAQMDDEYSVVLVKGEVMRRFTAMSMKVRNKKDRDNFRTMADAVLALLADKIGVTVDDLIKSSQKDDH